MSRRYLPTRLMLHDLTDVEGTIVSCMRRAGFVAPPHGKMRPELHHELFQEALVLIYEMNTRYAPRSAASTFSGYVNTYLPLYIINSWHKINPGHVREALPGGGRKWTHYAPPISLDRVDPHTDQPMINTLDGATRNVGNFITPALDLPA